jgi:hypothetical protein
MAPVARVGSISGALAGPPQTGLATAPKSSADPRPRATQLGIFDNQFPDERFIV